MLKYFLLLSLVLFCYRTVLANDRVCKVNIINSEIPRTNVTVVSGLEKMFESCSSLCQQNHESKRIDEEKIIAHFERRFEEYQTMFKTETEASRELFKSEVEATREQFKVEQDSINNWVLIFLGIMTAVTGLFGIYLPKKNEDSRQKKFDDDTTKRDTTFEGYSQKFQSVQNSYKNLESELLKLKSSIGKDKGSLKKETVNAKALNCFARAQTLAAEGRDTDLKMEDRINSYKSAFIEVCKSINFDIAVKNTTAFASSIRFLHSLNIQVDRLKDNCGKDIIKTCINSKEWPIRTKDVREYIESHPDQLMDGDIDYMETFNKVHSAYFRAARDCQ